MWIAITSVTLVTARRERGPVDDDRCAQVGYEEGSRMRIRDAGRQETALARPSWLRRTVMVLSMALLLPMSIAFAGPGATANAAYNPSGFDFWVDSSMGPIKTRIFRAADGNTSRVVYALDGLRARNDL